MIITLSGLPGVGKSSIGRELSEKLNCRLLDLDQEIEKRQHISITEIFREKGESGFREIELETLKLIISENDTAETIILSLGGGTPSIAQAREILKRHCTNIYLCSDCEKIAEDIMRYGTATRPMFRNKNRNEVLELLKELERKREKWYLEIADLKIDVSEYRYQRKEPTL